MSREAQTEALLRLLGQHEPEERLRYDVAATEKALDYLRMNHPLHYDLVMRAIVMRRGGRKAKGHDEHLAEAVSLVASRMPPTIRAPEADA